MKRVRYWVLLLMMVSLALGFLKTYRLSADSNHTLVCGTRECYLFVQQVQKGWAGTYLVDLGRIGIMALGGAVPPTHKHSQTTIVEVTASEVKTATIRGSFFALPPNNDTLYATGQKDDGEKGLWKWSGTDLIRPSAEEERLYWDATRAQLLSNRQTWSRTGLNLDRDYTFDLEGKKVVFIWTRDSEDVEHVFLERPNGTHETLWTLDKSIRRVSGAEFNLAF